MNEDHPNGIQKHHIGTELAIIIIPDGNPEIKYIKIGSINAYVVSNLKLFNQFLMKKIHASLQLDLTIIVVYDGIKEYMECLKFLSKFGTPKGKRKNNDELYKSELVNQSLPDKRSENEHEVENSDLISHFSFSFDVVTLIDAQVFLPYHLHPMKISLQQTLRFLSFKHGCSLACCYDVDDIINKEQGLLDFLHDIQLSNKAADLDSEAECLLLFQDKHVDSSSPIHFALRIPKGYDSCDKIKILAKPLTIENEERIRILHHIRDFEDFDHLYSRYVESSEKEDPTANEELLKYLYILRDTTLPSLDISPPITWDAFKELVDVKSPD